MLVGPYPTFFCLLGWFSFLCCSPPFLLFFSHPLFFFFLFLSQFNQQSPHYINLFDFLPPPNPPNSQFPSFFKPSLLQGREERGEKKFGALNKLSLVTPRSLFFFFRGRFCRFWLNQGRYFLLRHFPMEKKTRVEKMDTMKDGKVFFFCFFFCFSSWKSKWLPPFFSLVKVGVKLVDHVGKNRGGILHIGQEAIFIV